MLTQSTQTAMQDYVPQSTEFIFSPETRTGDSQCLGVPIIDNNVCDLTRSFSVELVSVDPFVRVQPGRGSMTVGIIDNDSKFTIHYLSLLIDL